MKQRQHRGVLLSLLVASWLLGLAHVALLPPYEGFDEIAHHATIQQAATASDGHWPRDGRVSQEIEAYIATGPSVYPQVAGALGGRGHDFNSFFDDPAAQEATRRLLAAAPAPPFTPGQTPNWELQQHPPLYYLALAPLEHMLAGQSLDRRLFALRLASWTLAALGLAVAAASLARHGAAAGIPAAEGAALLTAAWPFVMPMALPEFARLGNDSLCLLLLALAIALLLQLQAEGANLGRGLMLGLVLGAGLLTKAWFIAIGAGMAAFLILQGGRERTAGLVAGAAAAAIGGWWYAGNLLLLGNLSGSLEVSWLEREGGLAAGLAAKFSWAAWARALAAAAASFVWAGTQSLARLPQALLAASAGLLAGLLLAYLAQLPRFRARAGAWLPAFLVAPMAAALVYHSLVRIGLTGIGSGTPGWYLHILAPAFAMAIAAGHTAMRRWPPGRAGIALLGTGAALFYVIALASQLALFAGCVPRDADGRYYPLKSIACLQQPVMLFDRMSVVARPALGLGALGLALVLAGGAARRLGR